jgi:hypothetical protein
MMSQTQELKVSKIVATVLITLWTLQMGYLYFAMTNVPNETVHLIVCLTAWFVPSVIVWAIATAISSRNVKA